MKIKEERGVMTGGSLFSGIEGFGLGLLWSGLINEIKWEVEIDEYCIKVLEKHFPETKRFRDIKDCGKHNLEPVDVIFGGDPCQPYSVAGKRKGKEDDRYIWPEMARIIEELKPTIVINENVPGSGKLVLDQKITDLESYGYATTTKSIPACAVEAPHIRERIWILAYSDTERKQQPQRSEQEFGRRTFNGSQNVADTTVQGLPKPQKKKQQIPLLHAERGSSQTGDVSDTDKFNDNRGGHGTGAVCREPGKETELSGSEGEADRWLPESGICRISHGIPNRVDRLKCLGNAVVPQVAQAIGEIIKEWLESYA